MRRIVADRGAELVEPANARLAARQDRQQVRHSGEVETNDDDVVGLTDQEAAAVRRQRADQVQLVRGEAEARAIMLLASPWCWA